MIIKGIPAYWKKPTTKGRKQKADLKCIVLKTEHNLQIMESLHSK
jgi:hypothetical protein